MPGQPPMTPAATGQFGTPAPASSNSPITKVPRAWLVAGFRDAHDRFNVASQHPDSPEGLFLPLFETLYWAGVLEEDARQHNDPVLMALRFARDRVVHDWAEAVEGRNIPNPAAHVVRPLGAGAGRSGVIAPPTVWEWFWKPSQNLPRMKKPFSLWQRKRDEQAQYDAVFGGNPVRLALDELRRIF